MANDIYLIGEVGWEITLASVIEQVKNSDASKPINLHIHSGGGSVYDGLAIYNYLKGLDQEVHTASSGLVASIASIFFLAGKRETRKINSTDSFLIHLPMGWSDGNAEDFEKTAKELRDIENKLADIYASETNLTKEEAIELMKKDEMLDVNFLQEKGFVNEIIEFKAVANLTNNKKETMSEQLTEEKVEGLLNKFYNKFFGKKEAPTSKIVQDANGMDIDFTDVPEDGEPSLGDKATIDGSNAEGEYLMPSGDKFVFEAGELKEIIKEEIEDDNAQLDEANAKIAELEAENETLKAEKETATNSLSEIKNDFTELKNSISSDYKVNKKTKKEEGKEPTSRTFRNKK